MYLAADIEADGLDPTKIHVICVKEYPDGKMMRFTNMDFFREWVKYLNKKKQIKKWFFHNGLGYDVKVINKLIEKNLINPKNVVDTSVVSKLVNYTGFNTHSLKEIGEKLGTFKGDYTGGWEEYSEEMGEYCEQDVEVLCSIIDHYWKYITDPSWSDSMRLEHDTAWLCDEMSTNGFSFDVEKAKDLLESISKEMEELEDSFEVSFPPKLVEVKRLKAKRKADKTLYSNVQKAIDEYPKTELEGDELVVYDYQKFEPSSPKQRIEVLWDAGWQPFEKTKGHIKAERKARKSR